MYNEKTLYVILKWPSGYLLGIVTKEGCFSKQNITITWVSLYINSPQPSKLKNTSLTHVNIGLGSGFSSTECHVIKLNQ